MKKCIPVLLMLTILICGCSKQAQESTSEPVSDTFFAMDTTMDFRIYGDKSLLQDAQNVITDLEKKVSVTASCTGAELNKWATDTPSTALRPVTVIASGD